MAAAAIPSKPTLHPLFLAELEQKTRETSVCRLLDLGCGDGRLACELYSGNVCDLHSPLEITGVDVNEEAIRMANSASIQLFSDPLELHERPFFVKGNVSSEMSDWGLPEIKYDIVLLQLVVSVIGGPEERVALLANAHSMLNSGGLLLLSASGDSAAINDKYKILYEEDKLLTKEERTYYSRDEQGNVLYTTHHFTESELLDLLLQNGDAGHANKGAGKSFAEVNLREEREASSRRPGEAAIFYYVVAKKE
jgi:SAM-dependent methyltransferase